MAASILVADDEQGIRDMLAWELASLGYVVVGARDGIEAIAALRTSEFDVVFSDVRMPGLTGLDVLRAAKSMAPETEVIIATGFADLDSAIECVRGGAFDYIQKPFEMQHLVATIARAIERRELRAATTLYEASRAILDASEPQRLPQLIVEVAMHVMNADEVSLMLPGEDERLYRAYSQGPVVYASSESRRELIESVAQAVASTREPALLPEALVDDARFGEIANLGAIRSCIAYPMAVNARLVGVITIARISNERPFRTRDLSLAAVLASQVLLALENARLVRQIVTSERFASVGQLAAGVAHEINNPVAYILASQAHLQDQLHRIAELGALIVGGADGGAIRTAFDGAGGPAVVAELLDAAAEVREGALRVRDIVRDVWSLARADKIEPVVFDVNEALRSALRIAGVQVRHYATIVEQFGDDVWTLGSPGRTSQVFVNILVNAAQAIVDAPDTRVIVSTEHVGSQVVVKITDHGPGIEPDNLPRIFEPFFTTKSKTGTGLGLSISRDAARAAGGDLTVESTVGAGSTFRITLPYAAPPIEPRKVEPKRVESRRLAVLFVDDEPNIRRSYPRAFGKHHDVTLAEDGEQAWKLLEQRQDFDVIVCDLLMPNMTGMELYRRVCAAHPQLATAFVFVTGGTSEQGVHEFLASIPNRVLNKPFELSLLRQAIESLRRTPDPAAPSE